jgi:ParB family chromosome partitioning protein
MAIKHSGLGRGLDVLFSDNESLEQKDEEKGALRKVRLAMIEPRSDQPRKYFDEEALAQLAASISAHGLLQPILVRELPNDRYQIVAGERRWRACRMAGLSEIPVLVIDEDEAESAQISLIENIQRENLNPLEEAMAYRALTVEYGMTQEQLAERVGKSRPAIANSLRLLDLPDEILPLVRDGSISAGHARTLLGCKDKGEMIRLAQEVAGGTLSVRELEREVKRANRPAKEEKEKPYHVDYAADLSGRMMSHLGRRVVISDKGPQKTVTLYYEDNEDLEILLTQICGADFLDQI